MFSFLKQLFDSVPAGRSPQEAEPAVSPLAKMREAGQMATEHLDALATLFSLELQEYAQRQTRRAALLACAVVPAAAAYLLLCAAAAYLLQQYWGWGVALAALCLLNLVAAALALYAAQCCKPGEAAPLTRRELKNDWQCLKLLISSNKKR